jgi:lysophospholipase L1-like esterase
VVLVFALGLAEVATALLFWHRLPNYEKARWILRGEAQNPTIYQNCMGQPYLLYTPSPGFRTAAGVQHNEQGYRGDAVPPARIPGVGRVLCLGGSTTYGWGVARPDEAYPARLQQFLEAAKPPGVPGVEVINAGLPFGTTAEMLTHYHFKFHYYRPDLVILEAGGNDAAAVCRPNYQPDYSHWRRNLREPRPLPEPGRTILRSRLASLMVISLFFRDWTSGEDLIRPADLPPPTRWYPPVDVGPDGLLAIPEADLAFRHNLEALVREARADGCRVVLLPFRAKPSNTYSADLQAWVARHEQIMLRLAGQSGAVFLPFPAETISPENWIDDCHTNAAGCRQKAAYVAPMIADALWGKGPAERGAEAAGH